MYMMKGWGRKDFRWGGNVTCNIWGGRLKCNFTAKNAPLHAPRYINSTH